MKMIVCGLFALTLLGTTSAYADSWSHNDRGGYYRDRGGDGAALGLGLGLLTLGIIASQNGHRYDRDRYYGGYDGDSYGYDNRYRYDYDDDSGYHNRDRDDRGYHRRDRDDDDDE